MKRLLICFLAACSLAGVAQANNDNDPSTVDLPQVLHYEGSVTSQGSPYTGELDMRFGLALGPKDDLDILWTETWDADTRRVTVEAGRFQVNLGTHEPIPALLWAAGDAYLQIAVKRPGAADFTPLAGVHRVATVPGALWSARAQDLAVAGAVQVAGDASVGALVGEGLQAGGAVTASNASLSSVGAPRATFQHLTADSIRIDDAGVLAGVDVRAGNIIGGRLSAGRLVLSDGVEGNNTFNFYYLAGGGGTNQLFYREGGVLYLSTPFAGFSTVRVAGDRLSLANGATVYGSMNVQSLGRTDTTAVTLTGPRFFAGEADADAWSTQALVSNQCSVCIHMRRNDGQQSHACTPLDAGGRGVNLDYPAPGAGQETGLGLAYVCGRRSRYSNRAGAVPGL